MDTVTILPVLSVWFPWLPEAIGEVLKWSSVITSIIGVFALIATKTKNTADNKIAAFLLKAINWLGANCGKAKNGDV